MDDGKNRPITVKNISGEIIKEIYPGHPIRQVNDCSFDPFETDTLPINEVGLKDTILNAIKVAGLMPKYLELEQEALRINPNLKRDESCLALASWCWHLKDRERYDKLSDEEKLECSIVEIPKPLCLLNPDEIDRSVRKIGLKTKGDITVHPERKMPISQSLEKKMKAEGLMGRLCMDPRNNNIVTFSSGPADDFVKASDDLKTRWARAARAMYDSWNSRVGEAFELDEDNKLKLAMEFACRSTGIPVFEGDYADPEMIRVRMEAWQEGLLWEEIQALLAQNEDSLSKADAESIEINSLSNNLNGMLELLIPTLESLGLIESYKEEIGEREAKSRQNQRVGEVCHSMSVERKLDLARYLIKQVKV